MKHNLIDPLEQKDNKTNFLVISIISLRWPGAVNFYTNKENYFFILVMDINIKKLMNIIIYLENFILFLLILL